MKAEPGSGSQGTAVRCRASLGQHRCSCLSPAAQAGESQPQQRVTREYPTSLSSALQKRVHSKERSCPQRLREHRGREQRSCELTAKAGAALHTVLGTSLPLRGDVGSGMQALLAASMSLCLWPPYPATSSCWRHSLVVSPILHSSWLYKATGWLSKEGFAWSLSLG